MQGHSADCPCRWVTERDMIAFLTDFFKSQSLKGCDDLPPCHAWQFSQSLLSPSPSPSGNRDLL
jgi:hypothetical protein